MKLDKIRRQIYHIDHELFALLEERMDLALRSRKYKGKIADPGREAIVIDRARTKQLCLIEPEFAERVIGEIIAEGKRLQSAKSALVAFQGDHGAYGEIAARTLVPEGAYLPCAEFADVFQGVEERDFDLGAVPVENSLEGAVTPVNDLLTRTDLHVVGEYNVPVHHCLLATEGTDLREVRVVYSHPQALAQCRGFLYENRLEARPYYDTAGAARMLTREKPRAAAAIASDLAAELYGLRVLARDIEDESSNSTRFLLLARDALAEGGNKCSIIFAVKHESGRLFAALQLFAEAEINLTRIASMPLRTDPGNYSFFLDFEGSPADAKVAAVLAELESQAVAYKFLGCYPKAT
jgi:prephenate dehydratase/chorismate mutase